MTKPFLTDPEALPKGCMVGAWIERPVPLNGRGMNVCPSPLSLSWPLRLIDDRCDWLMTAAIDKWPLRSQHRRVAAFIQASLRSSKRRCVHPMIAANDGWPLEIKMSNFGRFGVPYSLSNRCSYARPTGPPYSGSDFSQPADVLHGIRPNGLCPRSALENDCFGLSYRTRLNAQPTPFHQRTIALLSQLTWPHPIHHWWFRKEWLKVCLWWGGVYKLTMGEEGLSICYGIFHTWTYVFTCYKNNKITCRVVRARHMLWRGLTARTK